MNKIAKGIIFLVSIGVVSCQTSKKNTTPSLATPTVQPAQLVSPAPKSNGQGLKLKPAKELVLENGLKVYVFRDMTLPRFSVNLLVKVGQKSDSLEKVGLNFLTASLLEKGTNQYTAPQLADKVASLGSDLMISPGSEYTVISIDGLLLSVDATIDIFSELVFKPTFQSEEIAKLKKEFVAQLKKIQDEPSQIADLGIENMIYRGTPLAFPGFGTEATLKKISKSDLIKNYLTFYRPNNSILSIVGNISEDVEKKIFDRFKAWPARPIKASVAIEKLANNEKNFEVHFKKDLVQSEIRVSMPLVSRKHPDYLKLRLINEVLGGGFVSRLNSKIRDQMGLTYGISSSLDLGLEDGYLSISTFTKSETTVQVVDQIKAELISLINEGVTVRELASAKNMVLAQFPRALETVDRIAYNFMYLDFYGVGPNYLYEFQRSVDKISLDEINQAIKTHFAVDKLKIYVLANPSVEKVLNR